MLDEPSEEEAIRVAEVAAAQVVATDKEKDRAREERAESRGWPLLSPQALHAAMAAKQVRCRAHMPVFTMIYGCYRAPHNAWQLGGVTGPSSLVGLYKVIIISEGMCM